ncbi:hypothetical protein MMC07_002615 [Pseudocyphellaria aurata]|nr:hypothetical protein [Pseudocyphellaria aurata]
MQQQGEPRTRRSFPDSSRSFAALQGGAHRPTFGPGVWHADLEQALTGSNASSPRLVSSPSLGSAHSSPRRAATARQSSLRVMLQQVLSTKDSLGAELAAGMDPGELAREAAALASEHAELSRRLVDIEQRQALIMRQLEAAAEASGEASPGPNSPTTQKASHHKPLMHYLRAQDVSSSPRAWLPPQKSGLSMSKSRLSSMGSGLAASLREVGGQVSHWSPRSADAHPPHRAFKRNPSKFKEESLPRLSVQRPEGPAESLVIDGHALNSPFADPSEVRHYLRPQLSGLHRMLSHLPGASPSTPSRQRSASLDPEDASDSQMAGGFTSNASQLLAGPELHAACMSTLSPHCILALACLHDMGLAGSAAQTLTVNGVMWTGAARDAQIAHGGVEQPLGGGARLPPAAVRPASGSTCHRLLQGLLILQTLAEAAAVICFAHLVCVSDHALSLAWTSSRHDVQCVQGVEITVELRGPGGNAYYLKRIRFSPRLFSESSATAWWTANKHAIVRQYGLVPSTEGSGVQADLESPVVRPQFLACSAVHFLGTRNVSQSARLAEATITSPFSRRLCRMAEGLLQGSVADHVQVLICLVGQYPLDPSKTSYCACRHHTSIFSRPQPQSSPLAQPQSPAPPEDTPEGPQETSETPQDSPMTPAGMPRDSESVQSHPLDINSTHSSPASQSSPARGPPADLPQADDASGNPIEPLGEPPVTQSPRQPASDSAQGAGDSARATDESATAEAAAPESLNRSHQFHRSSVPRNASFAAKKSAWYQD